MRVICLLVLGSLTVGCADTWRRGPAFDIHTPLRIAVLPFGDTHGEDALTSAPFTAALDATPLTSEEYIQTPATMLRNRFVANLRRSNLDVINPGVIDQVLMYNELYDIEQLRVTDPDDLGDLLHADLLAFGTLEVWDRTYYAVESTVTVVMRLRVIEARTGRTVYDSRQQESKSSGLSGGPTGVGSLIAAPILGLSNAAYIDLCNKVSRKVANPLVAGADPSVLAEPPPYISAAVHTAKDHRPAQGEVVTLYMIGSPGGRAVFRIGTTGRMVPMAEYGPGRYRGTYVIQSGESFVAAPIEVTLVRSGRRTAALLTQTPITSR